jgi:2-dehydro-3-deoxyphosphogluconate aldolase/(4S)-4-hydroxy-2-oxoglutarate aldolase
MTHAALSPQLEKIGRIGVVPVIVINDAKKAAPLANALLAGGIGCIEITLRTAAGVEAIREIAHHVPDMLVGAGTVLSVEQAVEAVNAGARFIVSPGFDDDIVDWCKTRGVDVLPGAVTPTEITFARKKGIHVVKFFPADLYGGPAAIKSLSGPFADIRFIPTSGVNADTLADFLKVPAILAAGGSWVATSSLIDGERYDEITRLSQAASDIVRQVRGG